MCAVSAPPANVPCSAPPISLGTRRDRPVQHGYGREVAWAYVNGPTPPAAAPPTTRGGRVCFPLVDPKAAQASTHAVDRFGTIAGAAWCRTRGCSEGCQIHEWPDRFETITDAARCCTRGFRQTNEWPEEVRSVLVSLQGGRSHGGEISPGRNGKRREGRSEHLPGQ